MSNTISSFFEALSALRESRMEGPVIFARNNVDVFSAEGLRPSPDLFAGVFRTSFSRSFFEYSSKVFGDWGADGDKPRSCAVFVEEFPPGFRPEDAKAAGGFRAVAVYDFGSPSSPTWGDHRAEFVPVYTPLMQKLAPISAADEKSPSARVARFSKDDFLVFVRDFMERSSAYPRFHCDGAALGAGDAMAFFEDLTMAKISETRAAKKREGVQFRRDASYAEKVLSEAPIPDMLELHDSVYQGFEPRRVLFRISFSADTSSPAVILEETAPEITRRGLFSEFIAECEELGEKWDVYEGSFSMRERPAFHREGKEGGR